MALFDQNQWPFMDPFWPESMVFNNDVLGFGLLWTLFDQNKWCSMDPLWPESMVFNNDVILLYSINIFVF